MKAKFQADNIEDIEFTMTITMPLREWIELQTATGNNNFCGREFRMAISNLIMQAQACVLSGE